MGPMNIDIQPFIHKTMCFNMPHLIY